MFSQLGSSIVTTRAGRVIAVASNAPADRVRALVAVGYDSEIARVFGCGAERAAVLNLAARRRLITGAP